jgi:hypothetical protein
LYGFKITGSNNKIDIDEGSGEVTVTLSVGRYSPQGLMTHIASKLNEALGNTYTVSFDRATRTVTIAADASFDVLIATGSNAALGPYSLLGLGSADLIGGVSYTGGSPAGFQYRPQFRLQNYLATAHNKRAVDAAVNKSTSGEIEVVSFGEERFMECNIMFITDIDQGDGSVIRSNSTGVQAAIDFLDACVDKERIDFVPDVTDPGTYETLLLESTPESSTGTGYQLTEEYSRGLPGYYQTGVLVFRKVN